MRNIGRSLPLLCCLATISFPAAAYVGPGLGIGALGAVIGVTLSVVLAVGALLWYPFKRLIKSFKSPARKSDETRPDTK